MKIERLSQDKIRIFLTFDDLVERGIQKEDMREIPKVHELFSEMMDQAYSELGFDATGPLAVEVFALPAQGMVVIVTKSKLDGSELAEAADDETDEDVYEMEVTLEQTDVITYAFGDFEDLLQAARTVLSYTEDGALYAYKNHWVLRIEPDNLEERSCENLISLLSEYGEATSVTEAVLAEYGKTVIPERAVGVLCEKFA